MSIGVQVKQIEGLDHEPGHETGVERGVERLADHAGAGERSQEQAQSLRHGRSLSVVAKGEDDTVEIRAEDGTMELRIRVTESGPVLEMQGIRLAMTAAESIEMKSKRVVVEAEESMTLASRGDGQILAQGPLKVRTSEYLGLDGKLVGLRSDERTIVREMAEREFDGDVEKCLTWLAEQAPAVDW
ncbi:hypothetical protein [Haliangium ochraceum]|uniref:Uncharacterized protein n=1 Tax=Haliangium ochraceum (strain DSM 14365 / JCM 11303 / SMP-2) TaxID=502025 RepID=D0LMM7_HALO1|nr:hypothetical protein [Haliangium ochraceum]ACY18714.1 hypothetical protein Hoch_6242 [Haliangium ochraceum DSM 14365]